MSEKTLRFNEGDRVRVSLVGAMHYDQIGTVVFGNESQFGRIQVIFKGTEYGWFLADNLELVASALPAREPGAGAVVTSHSMIADHVAGGDFNAVWAVLCQLQGKLDAANQRTWVLEAALNALLKGAEASVFERDGALHVGYRIQHNQSGTGGSLPADSKFGKAVSEAIELLEGK